MDSPNKCAEKRDIEIPDCKEQNPEDCLRTYFVYLPSIVCDGNGRRSRSIRELQSSNDAPDVSSNAIDDESSLLSPAPPQSIIEPIGTLPLIFAIHCFGCDPHSIADTFVPHADSHNAILVLPQGLQNSFNARHCCGYALENEVDDVGFIKYIQTILSEEYEFVDKEYSYGVGWSNGGFMVTHAASLFKSIAPISGHIWDIDPELKKGGTFCVDGICVDAPGTGKGIFLHHGLDDPLVKPTGCCADPEMPRCCCGIEVESCSPVMEMVRNWAVEVNGCELVEKEAQLVDTEEGSVEGENEIEDEGEADEEEADNLSDVAKFITTYTNSEAGIECQSAMGKGCKANTTICLHEHSGHFNRPSFLKAFPFGKEVIDFFAKDACEINGGTWNEAELECGACPEKYGGRYCLDDAKTIEKNAEKNTILTIHPAEDSYEFEMGMLDSSSQRPQKVAKGYFLFAIAVIGYAIRHRYRRAKTKDDRYFSNDEREEEERELVSAGSFRTS